MKYVLVTGSRYYCGSDTRLWHALTTENPDIVIHGGADGADEVAYHWCKVKGKKALVYFPDYKRHGNKAPLIRNINMAAEAPDDTIVLAAPLEGSRGTSHCMAECKKHGLHVINVTGVEE